MRWLVDRQRRFQLERDHSGERGAGKRMIPMRSQIEGRLIKQIIEHAYRHRERLRFFKPEQRNRMFDA